MHRIRTLLLTRNHVVVLDPDRVAEAATRPIRDDDVEKFEDELAQLGFVMSLDLAITIRRLPYQAIQELRRWILATLGAAGTRPQVPLVPAFASATPDNTASLYARRILPWLFTRGAQPCPWCGVEKDVGALDPCGHLVCRGCWSAGRFTGCAVCHRRVPIGDPYVKPPASDARVTGHDGALRLLQLGLDLPGMARARFERMLARTAPLAADDRAELELIIDVLGPAAAAWLPARAVRDDTLALAVARLWLVAPDRRAMQRATAAHLPTATHVLRVAVVLMGGAPDLARTGRLGPLPRALRRTILEALDRLPAEALVEDVARRAALWKRVGERLHPFEHAQRLPTAALAFAAARATSVSAVTFGPALRASAAQLARVRVEDDRVQVASWAAAVEDALRTGDARAAAEHLAARPRELVRRADHVLRIARDPDDVVRAIRRVLPSGAARELLRLAAHLARRTGPIPQRAWGAVDARPPLPEAPVAALVGAIHDELLARAAKLRHFARAVLDRALVEHAPLWTLACVHAAARTNSIYVRESDGAIAMFRRRDGESTAQRLARVHSAADHDGALAALPAANAPTLLVIAAADLPIPRDSELYLPDRQRGLAAQLDP